MGYILRNPNTPESLFCKVVDAVMSDVLEEGGFGSMDEILERGYVSYDKSKERAEQIEKERKMREILEVYDCGFKKTSIGIEQMFDESWINAESDNAESDNAENSNAKRKFQNYVWQEVYLEIFETISNSLEFSKIMKSFSNQIAYEYGKAVWNTSFDEYQRFFIMLWRMNISYSRINPKQKNLISVIEVFYKAMNKASRSLDKEFEKVDLDASNVYVLKDFFKALWKKIKQDEKTFKKMRKISNYFAEDFGKKLWYERFSDLQRFIIVCSEVYRAWQLLKQ